ncbi:MAG: ATP-binding cassette domain-containing protein [Actinomycetota bacterium]|nr:ATP-binding cassette domain-containing protein [Actinomycetota bacterium]
MGSDDVFVRVRDLRYRHPGSERDVLRVAGLEIGGRGLIALSGPSGAGKSTLLELLAGTFQDDYEGSVEVLGREWKTLRRDAERQRHLRRIGFIPQDFGLLAERTPSEQLYQDLADAGVPEADRAARIATALDAVGLAAVSDQPVKQLSGGQAQRVAIARMLARNVELVLADEPTANLDPRMRDEVMGLFRKLSESMPVVVVTHDAAVAAACDRTIILQGLAEPGEGTSEPVLTRRRSRAWSVAGLVAVVVLLGLGAVGASELLARRNHLDATGRRSKVAAAVTGAGQASAPSTAPAPSTTVAAPPTTPPSTAPPTTSAPSTTVTALPPDFQVLPPATVPPVSAECVEQLTYFADGNIGPLTCPNGGVNVVAWRSLELDDPIFTLGRFANPEQVLATTCQYMNDNETLPIATSAEEIAAAYYGWKFSVNPINSIVFGGCPSTP